MTAPGGEAPNSGSLQRRAHPSALGGGGRWAVRAGGSRCDSPGGDSRREGPRRGPNGAHVRGPGLGLSLQFSRGVGDWRRAWSHRLARPPHSGEAGVGMPYSLLGRGVGREV